MKIKRVLVPVDFSPNSLHALDYAVDLAKLFGAEVEVLFVIEPVYYAVPDFSGGAATAMSGLLDEQMRSGREQLATLGRRYARKRITLRTMMRSGTPYSEIVAAAKSRKSGLVVMATHGRTGLTHLLLGSVTERVVRSAPCPVLTIRGKAPRTSPARRKKRTSR
jgi:nucleotide-binding universal stress UspA family protein